jgi:uncharacterized protein
MAASAMPLDRLGRWLVERAPRPLVCNVAMFDGFVTAVVAGPVSMEPPDWICPLLGVDREAFDHGDTPEFAAICAAATHHNAVSATLSETPNRFAPLHLTGPDGEIDPRPWCMGFKATIDLQRPAWSPLLNPGDIHHGLLLPILLHCVDDMGRPVLGPPRPGPETAAFLRDAHQDIPMCVEAIRQYWMPIRFGTRR